MANDTGKARSQYAALLRSVVEAGMIGGQLHNREFKRVRDGLRLSFTLSWDLVGKLNRSGHEAVTAYSEGVMFDHSGAGKKAAYRMRHKEVSEARAQAALPFDVVDEGGEKGVGDPCNPAKREPQGPAVGPSVHKRDVLD